jgi:hypothetical protein
VTSPENVDVIRSMILDDRRIFIKKITKTLEISRERVGHIIYKILDMRKLSAKWVLKYLIAGQKRNRVLASQDILDRFWRDPVRLGFICVCVIQRPKNSPRNGGTVIS